MLALLRLPLLAAYYARQPGGAIAADGRAGFNASGAHAPLIEEQRNGTVWITSGGLTGNEQRIAQGWRMLDAGIAWQQPDGGFGARGYFHSNSLFLEALARACLIDPAGASAPRRAALERGCAWLMMPLHRALGVEQNRPHTHRCYLLAACFGQAGVLLNRPDFGDEAERWAAEGLARQQGNGVNPESGGADVSYQMVGVLMACIYHCVAPSSDQAALRAMMRRAIAWEAGYIHRDGSIDASTSTRVGHEDFAGTTKQVNVGEVFQALCFAASLLHQEAPNHLAVTVARHNRLPLPA